MNQEENGSLNNKNKEYINKLDESFNESNYYDEERKEFIKHIIEAKSLINECNDISSLDKIYSNNYEIISKIKTKGIIDAEKEVKKFNDFVNTSINEITEYVDVSLYGEKEAKSITDSLSEYTNKIKKTNDYDDINNIIRNYKTKIYEYKTDKDYYDEELIDLINSAKSTISSYVNIMDYRDNVKIVISSLIDSFNNDYWSTVFVNKMAKNDISISSIEYDDYVPKNNNNTTDDTTDDGVVFNVLLDLSNNASYELINFDFSNYPILNKDYFLSYFIGEESHYVSILNSLNTHTGSSAYQCNHILIIDEPVLENSIFESIAHITSFGTIC